MAEKSAGQSAEVVMALGEVLPEPPAGAGLVVVVTGLDVVVVAAVDFLPGLKIRKEMPTTTSSHDGHRDEPPGVLAALDGLLLGGEPRLPAGLLALTFLGGHGGSG